ncbi:hypothetical protein BDQ12DRAFT_603031 [Crucibulum laeve]|uniref:RING-type domain-containing protein n=1 Tax=Crucibulum laeve TaxID=68775 RepID=A0A5C3M3C2_9AGAR|nr:hypothetical protein BDQ12DRAFT_603031 [Crucibulum laeve]
MISCHICLDDLKMPVSLPCGHIFCAECLRRAVEAIKPYSSLHSCPTCRSLYTVAPIDPAVVPPHLRPHLTPSIRKVYLDHPALDAISTATSASSEDSEISSRSTSLTPPSPLAIEAARLRAENSALRTNCNMWRRRAEVHGAATLGLLELTRMARDQAVQIARERDEFQRRCNTLKRKLHDEECVPFFLSFPEYPSLRRLKIHPTSNCRPIGIYRTRISRERRRHLLDYECDE